MTASGIISNERMKDMAALHIRLILRKDRHKYEHGLISLICFGAGLDGMESQRLHNKR